MNNKKRLEEIAKEIERCKKCKEGTSGKAVPGEGNPDAEIAFIGEAPGKEEAKTGRPFVGRSGQLLRKYIRGVGLKESEVFITSPVKYLPKRGTPDAKQIAHGRIHLVKQLAVITPKVIVLLGNVACKALLLQPVSILKDHGKVITKDGRKYLLTIHPAAVLRFPKYKTILQKDFALLPSFLQGA